MGVLTVMAMFTYPLHLPGFVERVESPYVVSCSFPKKGSDSTSGRAHRTHSCQQIRRSASDRALTLFLLITFFGCAHFNRGVTRD